MSDNLGVRGPIVGVQLATNFYVPGAWVCTFTPEDLPSDQEFECYHGFVRGPGGTFLVYIENAGFGVGQNGTINEYAPSIPMRIRKGQTITLNWNIATGNPPVAWLYFRQLQGVQNL